MRATDIPVLAAKTYGVRETLTLYANRARDNVSTMETYSRDGNTTMALTTLSALREDIYNILLLLGDTDIKKAVDRFNVDAIGFEYEAESSKGVMGFGIES